MGVLIVDNSTAVRQRLLELVSASNGVGRVWQAASAAAALELARAELVDVAVVDLWLGADSGLELIRQLRAEQAQMVIIVLTNSSTDAHRHECLRRGAHFFFDKSHDFERAVAVAARVAAAPRASV